MEAQKHIRTKTVKTISLEDQMRKKLYKLEAGKRDHVRQRRLNHKKIVVLQSWLFLISLYAVVATIGLGLYRFGLA
jgi:hypothetical protein